MDNISKKYLLKLFCAFFAFVLFTSFAFSTVKADSATEIVFNNSTALSGGEAIIPISIKNNPGIAAIRFWLSYDAEKLDFLSAYENKNFESGNLSTLDNAQDGVLNIIWYSIDNINADGDFLYLKFNVSDKFIGKLSFIVQYLPEDILNDSLEALTIDVTVNDLTVYCRPEDHKYDNACDTECNVCFEKREITHDFEWVIDKREDCGKTGLKHEKCTVCGETQSENTVMPATGNHDFEWIMDKQEDCSENGIKHEECSVCHEKRNENTKIDATGNHIYDDDYDADCNVCGNIREVPTRPVLNGWVAVGSDWYFYENGALVTNQWRKDSIGWCYLLEDGKMATNMWLQDSVGWCYIEASGYCATNCWKKDSIGWIWLDSEGSMTKNQWVLDGGKWYYLDADGYMVTNAWMRDSIGWVWVGADGAMLTNAWVRDSIGWCYVGADGYAETNCWKQDSVGWCYLNSEGSMTISDWVWDNGWYYLDHNGYMVTGWHTIGGISYYFYSNGLMA